MTTINLISYDTKIKIGKRKFEFDLIAEIQSCCCDYWYEITIAIINN